MDTASALLSLTGPRTKPLPRKRSNPARTYCIAHKGGEVRVMHGNKIVRRYHGIDAESCAEAHLRLILRGPKSE